MTNLKDWNVHDALACNLFLSFFGPVRGSKYVIVKIGKQFFGFCVKSVQLMLKPHKWGEARRQKTIRENMNFVRRN